MSDRDPGRCAKAVPEPRPAGPMTLRILATTDLHMRLLPYDYLSEQGTPPRGLARAASLIQARRAEAAASILLDNGDFLQGGPMADLAARRAGSVGPCHPAIAAMNALRYDAAALGNHDFDFGLPVLRRAVAQARFPVLAANVTLHRGPGFAASCILERQLTCPRGGAVPIRIGVFGVLPPQTEDWDPGLRAHLHCGDILETARRMVPRLRARGVDLVVALAHSGIGLPEPAPRSEHAALALAALEGIDVVVAGHTHEVFPGPRWQGRAGIDPLRGTLAGKPAVMPGFEGSHLGVIDLRFAPGADGRPRLTGFAVEAEPVGAALPAAPAILRPVAGAHRATLRQLSTRIGRSATPLNSHFAVVGHDCGLRLVNLAQRWHVRRRLAGSVHAPLPILSASAPYRAGGRGGPGHYTDVPAGRLNQQHLADLYSFPNRVTAIRLTGAELCDWLERSASIFNRIDPGAQDAVLLDPDFPAYNFDVIEGVSWRIDLSQPARFHPDGRLADPAARRVRGLAWRDRPVAEAQEFVLATNSYRLARHGLFGPLVARGAVLPGRDALTRDVLHRYIRQLRRLCVPAGPNWGFAPLPGTTIQFQTAPAALERPLPDPARMHPLGLTADGFARIRLSL